MKTNSKGPMRILPQIIAAGFFMAGLSTIHAVEISPVVNGYLYGGQYFFENQESSLGGNIGVNVSPAIAFNSKWSLIPTLSASWRGTKSVQDLVGGGTLFTQTQDHFFNLKGIYALNERWQFKAGGGYRLQLLKETNDEKWGKGLFDYQKPSANVEVERIFGEDFSLRAGYDAYWIDFRNYSSLESQNPAFARANSEAKTLNTFNHSPYAAVRVPFPWFGYKGKFEVNHYYILRNFAQQKVVVVTGDISGTERKDTNHLTLVKFSLPFVVNDSFKLVSDINGGYNQLTSNQNNYDAGLTRFNPNYYSFREYSAGANQTFLIGKKPVIFMGGFNYVRRMYADRPVQDASGTYGAGTIETNEYYANFSLGYPINKNFTVQAIGNLGWSRSNMKNERTYRYNYVTSSYLVGVSYNY